MTVHRSPALMTNLMPFGIALGTVFASPAAFAFENFPEFQSLTETEQATFEGPSELTSEYSGVIQGYQKTPEWHFDWLSKPRAFDLVFGSINTRRFYMDQRLKIHQPLNSWLDLRFTYFDEGDPERQSRHGMLELVFWPLSWFGITLYGEPSFRKVNDDTGVGILLKPTPHHEIRLFNTFIDVTRLKYPDTADTHLEVALPEARGIVGRMINPAAEGSEYGDFLEYALRYETRTRWVFTEARYEYQYWKTYASAHGRKQWDPTLSSSFRLEMDRKFESRIPEPTSSTSPQTWMTDRLTSYVETTHHRLGPQENWAGSLGLNFSFRKWDTERGLGIFRDFTPYVRFGFWGFTLSYLSVLHDEAGDVVLGLPGEDRTEHRFQIRYDFRFGKTGSIVLLAAGDLDKMFTPKSWGGGSGQLQLFF